MSDVEWELVNTRQLHATKIHTCVACSQDIVVGEEYVRAFYREVNGTGTLIERRHHNCVKPK